MLDSMLPIRMPFRKLGVVHLQKHSLEADRMRGGVEGGDPHNAVNLLIEETLQPGTWNLDVRCLPIDHPSPSIAKLFRRLGGFLARERSSRTA